MINRPMTESDRKSDAHSGNFVSEMTRSGSDHRSVKAAQYGRYAACGYRVGMSSQPGGRNGGQAEISSEVSAVNPPPVGAAGPKALKQRSAY